MQLLFLRSAKLAEQSRFMPPPPQARTLNDAGVLVERARWTRFCLTPITTETTRFEPETTLIETRMRQIAEDMQDAPLPHADLTAAEALRAEQDRWMALFRDVRAFGGRLGEDEIGNVINILYEIAGNMEIKP